MRVKLLTSMAGPDGAFAYGDVIEIDDATAGRLIESGQAEAPEGYVPPVVEDVPVEEPVSDDPPVGEPDASVPVEEPVKESKKGFFRR